MHSLYVTDMPKNFERSHEQMEQELVDLRRRVTELEEERARHIESEKAAADDRRFLNLVINQLPNPIFWKGRDLLFVGCNQAFATITGMASPEEVIGKNDFELHRNAAYAASYQKHDMQVMDTDTSLLNFEDNYHRPDGQAGTVLTSKIPIHDVNGDVVGVLGVCTDITERKEAEERAGKMAHDLAERVKELSCLYTIARLVEQEGVTLDEILQGVVDMIPATWQHSADACARITLGDRQYTSDSFRESEWKLSEVLRINGQPSGTFDVCYRSQQPESDEGVFLKEERFLLNVLAARVSKVVERTRAEEALTQARKRYEELIQNLNVGVYRNTPGPDGVFLEANPEMVSMFEADAKEDFLGHRVVEFYKNPEQRDLFSQKMLRDGHVHDEELELKTLKGREFWASVTSVRKVDDEGHVYFDGVVEDITDRKLNEFQLEVQTEALKAAANGIVITDPAGQILWVNPAVETLTGFSFDEVVGQATRLFKSGQQSDEFYQELWNVVASGRVWRGEIINSRKDGTRYTEDMTITPVRNASGQTVNYIAIKQDITERKRAEKVEQAVYHIAETSSSANDLQAFCKSIHSVLSELMYAENFYIALLNEETLEISFPYFVDARDRVAEPRSLGSGLTDYILKTGETLWLGRPGARDEVHARGFAGKGTEPVDWVGVPLKRGWESFGVVAVQSYEEHVVYSQRDADLLTYISQQISSMLGRRSVEDDLRKTAAALREKNVEMQEDLNMAREVQQAMLPHSYPPVPVSATPENSALTFCHLYHPSGTVGGDFFDVQRLSDSQVGVFICDVMGHGIRAALVTAILRGILEELTEVSHDPGAFLTEMNRDFGVIFRTMDQGIFATALYLIADASTGEVTYANAGHPNPIVLKRRENRVDQLSSAEGSSGPALGLLKEYTYTSSTSRLDVEDAVVLYTDGIWEVESADGQMFGDEKLPGILQEHLGQPTSELFEVLLREAEAFTQELGFIDDICLVGLDVRDLRPG